ncbi:2,3-diphosphoglycerate-dependent phosphoglycerate mutase [Coprobacter tertius]|uniref:2,3-bisphosphoglycerate-dependent phosphoglycerate mutase n=1 Tax=Coprobacter tertius TaxID=2944915 RepID=A0ABT1MJ18_9BACT|nr:2,3-diphosphoglycerate-dependent phosphoglycerate mutase [Coprobacter tertius]MCP9612620.1 2,3-diphosphoglycerate-dependent phosphoglycerate mutase [Coprobacter tertius]
MSTLILLRHGESIWNKENRFTGWADPDLSEKGKDEACRAGQLLKSFSLDFDICFTSVLKRAIKTHLYAAEEINRLWVPVVRDWRLNERHYGALQGLNKAETTDKYGAEQVKLWRRSFDVKPPQVSNADPRYPAHDIRYKEVDLSLLPHGESLEDTVARVIPCWNELILPEIQKKKRVMIAAHGNSLRALVMYLQQMTPAEIVYEEIPTGRPLIYELGTDLRPERRYYLG